jgi:glutamate carboxypeptidase
LSSSEQDGFLRHIMADAASAESRIVERIHTLVEMESPSQDKAAVDRVTATVAEWCRGMGASVKLHRHRGFGDSLEARFGNRRSKQKPVLLLGHLDTVWDVGTLASMPWRVDSERISGPGVLDMKAGVVMALTAVELLLARKALDRPAVLLLHGDEEVGSPASRLLTERTAGECDAVYVLEPAQGEAGAYKTARKGVGAYHLLINGVAAHSGVDFANGHSAILELAHQLEAIAAISDPVRGVTVNPGVIGGGTRSNVVAAEAWAQIDVRIARPRDAAYVERKLYKLRPRDRACSLSLTGGINRPPMERTRAIAALFQRAKSLADRMDRHVLQEASTGGGSDGNFTAALGIPTLDGMGAVGSGAHAVHEHLLRSYLAPRTALLAAMISGYRE